MAKMNEQSIKHSTSWTAIMSSTGLGVLVWGHHLRIPATLKPHPHSHLHGATVDIAKLTLSPYRCLGFITAVSGPQTATGSFLFCSRYPRFLSAE